jgi:hypothetical protein
VVVMKSIIFWDVTPCSLLRCNLATCLLAGLAEISSSTLKMETICSSETSITSQQTTRCHIPEDYTLYERYIMEQSYLKTVEVTMYEAYFKAVPT